MEVRRTSDRGFAVFATQALRPGALVLRESPLLTRGQANGASKRSSKLIEAQRKAARLLMEAGEAPEVADAAWSFLHSFVSKSSRIRRAVLALHRPRLDDPMPKVQLACRLVSILWPAMDSRGTLREAQEALLVDLFNNFDGSVFQVASRMNHACAPALHHSDLGLIQISRAGVSSAFQVAFACWNEQLSHLGGISGKAEPLGSEKLKGAVAVATVLEASQTSLWELAHMAHYGGALALLCPSPMSLSHSMQSSWAQPASRFSCPQVPAFVMKDIACVENSHIDLPDVAGKEFRSTRHIRPGEELTISYLSGRALPPRHARRSYLFGAYGFWCKCSLCIRPRGKLPRLRRLACLLKCRKSRGKAS